MENLLLKQGSLAGRPMRAGLSSETPIGRFGQHRVSDRHSRLQEALAWWKLAGAGALCLAAYILSQLVMRRSSIGLANR
jgi:hypothetical protein